MSSATFIRAATIAVFASACTAPLLCAGSAMAAPRPAPPAPHATITVSGTGTASATPDELSLVLDVSTQAPAVRTALDSASQAMSKVRDKLLADGVAAADLQSTGLSVQPQYSQQSKITGYQVTESLTAELRHLATAGQAISDAVEAGGNAVRVDSASFDLTDQSAKLLAKARTAAVTDARTRAADDSAAAGLHLGKVLSISEADNENLPRPMFRLDAPGAGAAAVPLEPGTQQLTVSVIVSYELS
jgi:uncharacterized protein YggE